MIELLDRLPRVLLAAKHASVVVAVGVRGM